MLRNINFEPACSKIGHESNPGRTGNTNRNKRFLKNPFVKIRVHSWLFSCFATTPLFLLLQLISILLLMNPDSLMAQPDQPDRQERYLQTATAFVEKALTEQKGYRWLGELCEIGPRLSGSENSLKAIHWAKAKMEALGFDRVILQPVMVPRWVRGKVEEARVIESARVKGRKLAVTALGGSIATPREGISAEVVEVKDFAELAALGEKARGKIVFFNRPFAQQLTNTFAGYGKTVDQRVYGAVEAAQAGGVAALVRSVTTRYDNVPHTGSVNYREGVTQIPAAAIGQIDADFLSAALKQDPHLKVRLKLSCQTLPDAQSYNVIGDLLGSEFPKEYIVLAGHFDSWDKGCGAHDDGAGCLQALEALDLFKRLDLRPRRTLRCVFYINEENGIRGALKYAREADSLGLKHLAAIESDRGAFAPRGFSVEGDSAVIARMNAWLPYLQKADIEWVRPGGSGVDVSQIKNAKALIGYVPDSQRYFDFHHSDNDVYEAVNPREMQMGAAAMAILAYLLSEEGL